VKLDLGCGSKPEEGYVGIDLPDDESSLVGYSNDEYVLRRSTPHVDSLGIIRFDLACGLPWPFENESIDGLFSSHLVEHLPNADVIAFDHAEVHYLTVPNDASRRLRRIGPRDSLLRFLDEAWRVTKPGGEFLLRWPALLDEETRELQVTAFQDPTHRRFIPLEQIHYWSVEGRKTLAVPQYRVSCDWVPLRVGQRKHAIEGRVVLVENEVLLSRGSAST